MGVELDVYRCRVGMFVPHHGAGESIIPLYINFTSIIKMLGSVSFVRILLILAGIEQNPGPVDQFIFRYQYLLVHIGTDVLRQVLDAYANNDVGKFLAANNKAIQSLITKKVINADQQKILQPVNGNPCLSKFDISLLACILRNMCGLKSSKDPVWQNPAPNDYSIEADITRLRICRNDLMHSDKLRLPETDLDAKWKTLSAILTRLNNKAGIANLCSLINDAQKIDLDEEMRKSFNETIEAWAEQDRLLDERLTNVEHKLTDMEKKMDEIEQSTQQPKCQHLVGIKDIQKRLIDFYQRSCKTLPVIPLSKNKDDNLLLLYEFPTMHILEKTKDTEQITCYEHVFLKENKSCKEIYMTGDAGVGKTSFCQHLCLMWCHAKCGQKLVKEYEYVSKFDCVFLINLRDTEHYHVVDMIKECYFDHLDPNSVGFTVDNILRKTKCLIIFDGLDEWNPKKDGKKTHELPKRLYSENCIHLTTCRPYRIENLRLATKDVDHQISISGIHGKSLKSYIENILNFMNRQNNANKKSSDFESEIKKCGLTNEIGIPIIASHLVVLWYEKTLDGMTRTLIYANILEMLFERAKQRKVSFPPSTTSTLQLPDTLSGLEYLNEYVSLLYNVCHLSFRSMFKQDQNATNLVFTRRQLQSKPYCFSAEEIDFLCKIGILSTNEVFGCFSVDKLKISFIHKSYLEFFAALFISSFDSKNSFKDVTKTWKCLTDVVQYENFFSLLAGFSLNSIKSLFENIYLALSDDLTSCRKNALFHYDKYSYKNQIKSLQNIVVSCFKEVSRSNDKTVELRMEDFAFDNYSRNADISRKLLLLNTTNVKSLHCDISKYFDEFDQIKNLQCINIFSVPSDDFVKFTQCMLQHTSTLNTVCIDPNLVYKPLIPDLLVRNLHHLTSLSLSKVIIQHNSLCDLVKFLSNNFLIENIKFSSVSCFDHQRYDSDCTLTLNLLKHTKLASLYLWNVNILCNNVNNCSLKYISLCPLSERIVRLCYIDLFNCIKNSQLEYLYIHIDDIDGFPVYMSGKTMKTLTSTVKTLPCIKLLKLWNIKLPDDFLLQLHPQVTQVEIKLDHVTMSRQCFLRFVESCVNKKSEIKVELGKITSFDGETHSVLSWEVSVNYMSEHLQSFSTINITYNDGVWLFFETTKCQ